MRAVLTRVKHASVTIDGKVHGQIGEGFLILLGITHEDTEAQAVKLADKLTGLRIFEDENGKMNRGLDEVKGELSGIALDIASQVIEREVNEKDHEAFINEFIKNVGEAS